MNPRAFTGIAPTAVALVGSQSRTTPWAAGGGQGLAVGGEGDAEAGPVAPAQDCSLLAARDVPKPDDRVVAPAASGQGLTVGPVAAVHAVGRDMEDGLLSVRGALEDLDHTTPAACGELRTVG